MNMFKQYLVKMCPDVVLIVACADDNAVEFFKKHGFNEKVDLNPIFYEGFTKSY